MTIYARIQGSIGNNPEYQRLTAAGWVFLTAARVRANYYYLNFRCQG